MTKIKICGIHHNQQISILNECLPDYVGFVFAKSKRQVSMEQAAHMREKLDSKIETVGVFVNAPLEEIRQLCREKIIQVIQLHGDEDECYIQELREYTSRPIIKAVRVKDEASILDGESLSCDMMLLDTFSQKGYGGFGESFDLQLIPRETKPFFLAGGLSPENVVDKIMTCRPYGVDVSSGVETNGKKDNNKIRAFIESVRRIEL